MPVQSVLPDDGVTPDASDANLALQQQRVAATPTTSTGSLAIPTPPPLAADPKAPTSSVPDAFGQTGQDASLSLDPQAPSVMTSAPPQLSIPPLPAAPANVSSTVPTTASTALSPNNPPSDAGTPSTPSNSPTLPTSTPTIGTAAPITAAPGAGTTASPFTDGNTAIGTSVLPNTDPRVASLQSLLDGSASTLGTANRTQIAQNMFDTFAKSTDPAYQLALRQATQQAAGAGRIGSGMLRTSYGDLANQRDQQLQNEQDTLVQNAENGTIQDNLNNVSALSGLENQAYGEQANTNDQLRSERDYQGTQEEQAFQRALDAYQLDQSSKQQQFNNGVTLTTLGQATDPTSTYEQMAAQLGMDPSVIASLAAALGKSTQATTTPTTA